MNSCVVHSRENFYIVHSGVKKELVYRADVLGAEEQVKTYVGLTENAFNVQFLCRCGYFTKCV